MPESMTRDEIMALPPAIDIRTAARALGISASTAYAMAKADEFPVRLLRLGRSWRVPTAELARYLGLGPGRSHDATASAEDEKRRKALDHARTQLDKWTAEVEKLERELEGGLPVDPRMRTSEGPSARSLLTRKSWG